MRKSLISYSNASATGVMKYLWKTPLCLLICGFCIYLLCLHPVLVFFCINLIRLMKGTGEGKKGRQILLLVVLGFLLVGSCTKTNEFTIGKDFMAPQTRLMVIDTFRVDLSTILIDSIITSSKRIAYVGNYEDTISGLITSRSFFDLDYELFGEIDEKAVYDSAAFVLQFTEKNIGDTLHPMSISVHRLTELIVPVNRTALFNTSSFDYEEEPMSTIEFYPGPQSSDTAVNLTVNSFGEELFDLIRKKDEKVSNEELFNDYIKGFVLTSGSVVNKAILGFKAGTDQLVLKLFYHVNREESEKKEIIIKMGDTGRQFNKIDFDLSDTPLRNIREEKNEIPATLTGNRAFMQGMTGLYVKCLFPTVQNLLADEGWKILKAELIVEPVKYSYEEFELPDSLYLYAGDKRNNLSLLRDGIGQQLMGSFQFDDYLHEDNRYTFEITDFILNELSDSYFNPDQSLILGLAMTEQGARFERLIVEGRRPPVKLKLYYLSY